MTPEITAQIPKEAYYLVGVLILGNISTITAFFKSMTDRAVEIAVMKEQIKTLNILISNHDDDIRAAHDKIRELNGP